MVSDDVSLWLVYGLMRLVPLVYGILILLKT